MHGHIGRYRPWSWPVAYIFILCHLILICLNESAHAAHRFEHSGARFLGLSRARALAEMNARAVETKFFGGRCICVSLCPFVGIPAILFSTVFRFSSKNTFSGPCIGVLLSCFDFSQSIRSICAELFCWCVWFGELI